MWWKFGRVSFRRRVYRCIAVGLNSPSPQAIAWPRPSHRWSTTAVRVIRAKRHARNWHTNCSSVTRPHGVAQRMINAFMCVVRQHLSVETVIRVVEHVTRRRKNMAMTAPHASTWQRVKISPVAQPSCANELETRYAAGKKYRHSWQKHRKYDLIWSIMRLLNLSWSYI